MATPVEQLDKQIHEDARKQIDLIERTLKVSYWVIGIIIFLAIVVFAMHRDYWLWNKSFNENVLGTFGDFVGGFVGTIITFLSVILLVKTLSNQISVNSSVVTTNNNVVETNNKLIEATQRQIKQADAQIFDSKFNAYLKSYQDAVSSYHGDMSFGKEYMDELVNDFRNHGFTNNLKYIQRSEAAVKAFQEFYAKNRLVMSVHMRTLYLLMKLIGDDNTIDEPMRVHYAKCVRGQLTENELFLMRYNCYSPYGENMKWYVNRFNLTKHLPTMSLLEFVKWRSIVGNDEELINALDAMFLELRSDIEDMMGEDADEFGERMFSKSLSKRYDIRMTFSDENKKYKFELFKIVHRGRTGTAKRPAIENALDKLTTGNLRQMFLDFHIDFFLVNNFFYYNGENNGQRKRAKFKSDRIDDPEVIYVNCTVESEYPIVLKYSQLEDPA